MNKQRKVVITTTYNEMGIIIDTKAEEVTQPNLQPTCNQLATDCISRQAAIDALSYMMDTDGFRDGWAVSRANVDCMLRSLPSAQPFHNITMNDVLEYIDSMPEDVWQEFTACLECRGWELQRRTVKWCGGEFA